MFFSSHCAHAHEHTHRETWHRMLKIFSPDWLCEFAELGCIILPLGDIVIHSTYLALTDFNEDSVELCVCLYAVLPPV